MSYGVISQWDNTYFTCLLIVGNYCLHNFGTKVICIENKLECGFKMNIKPGQLEMLIVNALKTTNIAHKTYHVSQNGRPTYMNKIFYCVLFFCVSIYDAVKKSLNYCRSILMSQYKIQKTGATNIL